jgi:hypothetical protein
MPIGRIMEKAALMKMRVLTALQVTVIAACLKGGRNVDFYA